MDDLDLIHSAQVLAITPGPERTLVVRDDWVRVTEPAAKTHYRNGVYHSVVGDGEAGARIAATCAHYESVRVPFRWVLGPRSRPRDLEQRLLAAGFVPFNELSGLVLDVDTAEIPAPDDISVDEVAAPDTWVDVTARGWGMTVDARARFQSGIERQLAAAPRIERFYVASRAGVPIATAAMRVADGVAYLSGAVVLPDHRGRGAYRALLSRRVGDLRGLGMDRAANLAVSTTSAPICLRVGFREVCRFRVLIR